MQYENRDGAIPVAAHQTVRRRKKPPAPALGVVVGHIDAEHEPAIYFVITQRALAGVKCLAGWLAGWLGQRPGAGTGALSKRELPARKGLFGRSHQTYFAARHVGCGLLA